MKLPASKAYIEHSITSRPLANINSVDQATDELMQKIVREEFNLCTIIAIAHRLNTLIDFDNVIVLDGGRVVESGSPRDLLSKDSLFKKMWRGDTRHID